MSSTTMEPEAISAAGTRSSAQRPGISAAGAPVAATATPVSAAGGDVTATGPDGGVEPGVVSAAGSDGSVAARDVSAGPGALSAGGVPVSAAGGDVAGAGLSGWLEVPDESGTKGAPPVGEGPQGSARLRFWLGLAFFFGGLAVAGIGFWLSFGNLTTAAHTKFGFDPGASSLMFALGVDATIVVCLIGDLMFAAKGRAFWLLRPVAHAFTALTIYLNATAHDLLREAVPHAAMPIVFVVLVEAGRHYLVQEAHLEMGIGRDPIPWHRWILHPFTTTGIFRTMKTWEMTYTQVRKQRRGLAVYKVWLEHREEIEAGLKAGKLGVLDRLPVLLAPHGVSVEQALALPARMRRAEQQRIQRQERENRELAADKDRHERELKQLEELEKLKAQEQSLLASGKVAELRARLTGQEKVAVAEAEGATAAAELATRTTLAAARRLATEEERRAALEEAAEETARTAEARKRAAETNAAAAEIERTAAEDAARTAEAKAVEERRKAEKAEAEARAEKALTLAAEQRRLAAEKTELAAEAELRAAEKAELAAETKARAVLTAQQRQAALEEATEETARTAEARKLAAEANAEAAEIERTAAEDAARTAEAKANEERRKADQAEAQLRAQEAEEAIAETARRAAEKAELTAAAELAAAETARQAAETRARAAHAEALGDLTQVQIKTRIVARLLLTTPQATGAQISAALGGASPSTATTYKQAAQELISKGYPDTDPDLTTAPATATVTIPGPSNPPTT